MGGAGGVPGRATRGTRRTSWWWLAAKQAKCLVQSSCNLAQSKAKAQQQQAQSEGAPSSGNIHDKRIYSHWPYCGRFPGGVSGKGLTCQCRRCKRLGCDPWVGKISWRRAQPPTQVFLPGEFPWAEEPGRLWPIESQRVGLKWNLACMHKLIEKAARF